MNDYTLHRGKKYFCRYCLQAFSTEEILTEDIMPKKGEHICNTTYDLYRF